MSPDLGEVERIPAGALGPCLHLRVGHYLHLRLPPRKVASFDRAEQIFLCRFARTPDHLGSFRIAPVPVTLLGLEVELHPHAFAGSVDQAVGVQAIAVDVAYAGRQAAVGHRDRHLVQALG